MEQNNVGIYCWTSPSGKKYIGQSVDLKRRKSAFLRFGRRYTQITSKIDYARKKYNKESDWKYEILEYCTEEELDERETYWISFYNTVEEGYNLESGGNLNKRHSEETKQKISEKRKNIPNYDKRKPVLQYSLTGEFIEKWVSALDVSEKKGINVSSISSVCSGKCKSAGGYIWRFYEGGEIPLKTNSRKCEYFLKSILQYSLTGEFIDKWDSASTVTRELGIGFSDISAVCRGKCKSAGGYIWRFYEGGEIPQKVNGIKRVILQYSLDGEFIKEWKNAFNVTKELGISSTSIGNVCRGKLKTAGGFIWKYKETA